MSKSLGSKTPANSIRLQQLCMTPVNTQSWGRPAYHHIVPLYNTFPFRKHHLKEQGRPLTTVTAGERALGSPLAHNRFEKFLRNPFFFWKLDCRVLLVKGGFQLLRTENRIALWKISSKIEWNFFSVWSIWHVWAAAARSRIWLFVYYSLKLCHKIHIMWVA